MNRDHVTPQQNIFFKSENSILHKNKYKHVFFKKNKIYLPDDASIEEREDEVESNRAPRNKMVHPRPEMSL